MLLRSTDAYEHTVFSNLVPFYLLSLVCYCVLLATWRGNLLILAISSAVYLTSIVTLPYLKYTFLFGTAYDNMHHYQVAGMIYSSGHLPSSDPYFGFTAFHSVAVAISLLTDLPLLIGFKTELIVLIAVLPLSAYWITTRVLRTATTGKLAVLSGIIVFALTDAQGPPLVGWLLTVLTVALSLEFVTVGSRSASRAWILPVIMLILGTVITHHQTSFFAVTALVCIGVITILLRDLLKSTGILAPVILMVGLVGLVASYLWWTYYAGFTAVLQTVAAVVQEETPEVPTTIGRGIAYYGLPGWLFRTMILYAQRGQEFVWTGLGLVVSILYLLGRVRRRIVDSEAHAVVFMHSMLFMLLWSTFIFIPYFVIGPDRFFRFAFLVSPSFMALGMESVYSALARLSSKLSLSFPSALSKMTVHTVFAFLLLVLVFTDFSSPFFLTGLSAGSSSYQYNQLIFLDEHYVPGTTVVSHLFLTNQIPPYTTHIEYSRVITYSGNLLHDVYLGVPPPSYVYGASVLFYRVGPAGSYFEAINIYFDDSWVPNATDVLLSGQGSLVYNSGEAFIFSPAL